MRDPEVRTTGEVSMLYWLGKRLSNIDTFADKTQGYPESTLYKYDLARVLVRVIDEYEPEEI